MPDTNTRRMVSNGDAWKRALVIGLIGLLSGSGGAITLGQVGVLRPDPFTGAQGNVLRLELERKIEEAESRADRRIDEIEKRLRELEIRSARQHYPK